MNASHGRRDFPVSLKTGGKKVPAPKFLAISELPRMAQQFNFLSMLPTSKSIDWNEHNGTHCNWCYLVFRNPGWPRQAAHPYFPRNRPE